MPCGAVHVVVLLEGVISMQSYMLSDAIVDDRVLAAYAALTEILCFHIPSGKEHDPKDQRDSYATTGCDGQECIPQG